MPFPTHPTDPEFVRQAVEAFKPENIAYGGEEYMTQLRKIFSEVIRTERAMRLSPNNEQALMRLDLLRPRIQYLCARAASKENEASKLDSLWREGSTPFVFSKSVPEWLQEVRNAAGDQRLEAMARVQAALEAMVAFAKVKQIQTKVDRAQSRGGGQYQGGPNRPQQNANRR